MVALVGCGSASQHPADAPEVPADAMLGDVQFGQPCASNYDCTTGYCVEPSPGYGGTCSMTCTGDCPTGYDCLAVASAGATTMLCVPSAARLCSTCATDAECPGGGCLTLDASQRCTSSCNKPGDCPAHYTCSPDPAGTHTGSYCQPETGSCTCNDTMDGATRTCSNANAIGTCFGTQTCAVGTGWSTCNAATATAEKCNGIDDDCNFLIDDGVGGGGPCTIANAFGSCPGVQVCDGANGFVCHGQLPMQEVCDGIDNNCNGVIDEGFANLGTVCQAGVGACLRYGAIACNATHDGTACTAVAGTPVAELCNQVDDDCDGKVDETFPTLGTACSAGLGVCARYGSIVCAASHTTTTCSVTAGPPTGAETCNYLDDDCNGIVDDPFRDASGAYSTTAQNCGACGNDCTAQFSIAHSTGICTVVATQPQCAMQCSAGYFDLDASTLDGCEFFLDATAIYVSGAAVAAADDATCGLGPTGTGVGNHPCKTITFGQSRAAATGRANVLVANATYNEAVTLANGENLLGGYTATFSRDLANTSTVIQGVASSGVHDTTVTATNIASPTVFEGFVVRGSDNAKPGGNSYAIYVASGSAGLAIRSNQIFAGRGGPGGAGSPGTNGTTGTSAAAYTPAAYDAYQVTGTGQCAASNNRGAYGGGALTCAGVNVAGGNGGGNNCTPNDDMQASTTTAPATAGSGNGGAPGASGYDGQEGDGVAQDSNTCFLPGDVNGNLLPMYGADGVAGGIGANAAGVAGCSAAGGSVVGGHWVAGAGAIGALGVQGGGGGGGGAGGGAQCESCATGNGKATLGGHGGGGGSGGCGGTGGIGGGGGGAAFGIFVTSGGAPTIASNTIALGAGGSGGAGGIGGAGGLGGPGGSGGQIGALFCTGKGGNGGDGGNGGAGSGGGGGCGGGTYGIFTSGVGTPAYCASNTVSGGVAGPGGPGGYSGGAPGGNGLAGILSACTSM